MPEPETERWGGGKKNGAFGSLSTRREIDSASCLKRRKRGKKKRKLHGAYATAKKEKGEFLHLIYQRERGKRQSA